MPDLVSRWDYFYERTIGCIGSLNDWLERALSLSLRDGGAQMKPEHWEKRAPLLSQCQKKFSQIQQAEDELREDESSWMEFRDELWKKSKANCINSNETTSKDEITLSEEIKSSKRKKRVGIRNPHRDPIGKNARR